MNYVLLVLVYVKKSEKEIEKEEKGCDSICKRVKEFGM